MISLKLSKKNRRLVYVGLISYLLFLLVTLPASFVTRYILPSIDSAGVVKLKSVRGSLWTGQANNTHIGKFYLGALKWNLSSMGLLLGNINIDVDFKSDIASGNGDVSLGFGGSTSANDVEINFPAEMLQPLFAAFPISISGDFRGSINEIDYSQDEILQVDGRVVWQGAALRAPQNIELGDFLINMSPHNQGTKIKITDENQGPVKTELNIKLSGSGKYTVNGWMQARDQSQQHITEALRFIGARADSTGRFWVSYNGSLGQKNIRGQRRVR